MQLSASARPVTKAQTPTPSVSQAWLGLGAAFGVALVAAYEAIALSVAHIGVLPAVPLGLITFVVVGAVALVAAAYADERFLSR